MSPHSFPLRSSALLACALAAACVDSSLPADPDGGFPPPTEPPTIDVAPQAWKTVPGKSTTFSAVDPVSNKPLLWSPPAGLSVIEVESHSITLGSTGQWGKFELHVQSSVDSQVVGLAKIQVVPFGFSGTLGGLAGNAAHQPKADVAASGGAAASARGALEARIYLALLDPDAESNALLVYDHAFATLLETHEGLHFNNAQPPRIAADALGRAYWIEQYYDAALGERVRRLSRLDAAGVVDVLEWTPQALGGLQLVPGTDIACDDAGVLYFLANDGFQNGVVRFDDPFAAGAQPQWIAPLAAAGSQVELAVDAQGRLLVALDAALERWTLDGGALEVEALADLGAAPADLDVDADGTLYALLDSELVVLDAQGLVVATVQKAQVGLPEKVPFEHLLGLGVDDAGNLRFADDPLADDPDLGVTSLRTFALDVQVP